MARKPEQIVDDQVKTWAFRETEASRRGDPATFWPVIIISREAGTPGDVLARLIGQRTGFLVWDKELLQVMAREWGGDERLMQMLDERRRTAIHDAVYSAMARLAPTNSQYLRALVRVVRTIAMQGRSIIVGRGAQYICEPATALRIRLVAPLEHRLRSYALAENVSDVQARRTVEQMDAEQADFIRYHFRKDVHRTDDYDLVINAAAFSLEQSVELVLHAYEVKVGRRPLEETGGVAQPREAAV